MKTQGTPPPKGSIELDNPLDIDTHIVPYDGNLLERARTQWEFGDWASLATLDRDTLQHHPDRAKLALLAAAGHLQTNNAGAAKQFIRLAQDWGCSKKLISQILVSGVHNTLGRAAAASGQEQRAFKHFEGAIRTATLTADVGLFAHARSVNEMVSLGLLPQAAGLVSGELKEAKQTPGRPENNAARMKVLEIEVELLHHELSLAQQRQQLFHPPEGVLKITMDPSSPESLEALKKCSVSQLGQDLWVLERTEYKRGGFFVEFGATDGVLLSNSWLLEKEFGWNGICAEPNPKFFEQLKKNRSCSVSEACIGASTGDEVEFILADVYGGTGKYANSDMHADKRRAYAADEKNVLTLKTVSLHDFLLENNSSKTIDYLSIDTEGSEFEILSAFPFHLWDIKLITVEHNFAAQRTGIRSLLEKNGYEVQEAEFDDWYFKRRSE